MKGKKIKIIIGSIIGLIITIMGMLGLISIFITEHTIQHSTITSDTKKQTTSNKTDTVTPKKTTINNNKAETEYNNIVNNINNIGITNLTKEQLTDFINQYMKFIDNKNDEY